MGSQKKSQCLHLQIGITIVPTAKVAGRMGGDNVQRMYEMHIKHTFSIATMQRAPKALTDR